MKATIVKSYQQMREVGPGAIWKNGTNHYNFVCPCGCGHFLAISIEPGRWTMTGWPDAPTVTPSILHSTPGGCGWHGYLTNGEWRSV